MASPTRISAATPARITILRHSYAQAVLTGIYAAMGRSILDLENHAYIAALSNARKVAFDQADEMLKGAASS